jgi:hypothetical protein
LEGVINGSNKRGVLPVWAIKASHAEVVAACMSVIADKNLYCATPVELPVTDYVIQMPPLTQCARSTKGLSIVRMVLAA